MNKKRIAGTVCSETTHDLDMQEPKLRSILKSNGNPNKAPAPIQYQYACGKML